MSGARQRARGGPGTGRWIALGAAVALGIGAAFGVGVYVGRASRPGPGADAEPARKAPAPRRSGLVEPVAERARESREPLTFYQTLTAPLAPLPGPSRAPAGTKPPGAEPAPARSPAEPRPAPAAAPARLPAERPAPAAAPVGPSLPAAAAEWTVQVGVFRERRQAEALKRQLAEAGVDAHIADTKADDGQARHRVRVGSFKTRDDAARVAARVGQERRVPTYVTLR